MTRIRDGGARRLGGAATAALITWEEQGRREDGRGTGQQCVARRSDESRLAGERDGVEPVRTREVWDGRPGEKTRTGSDGPVILDSQTTRRFGPGPKSTRGADPGKSRGSPRDLRFPNEPLQCSNCCFSRRLIQ
jgi:hypothetical protein